MKLYLPTVALSFVFIGCSAVDLLQQPLNSDGNALDSPLDAGKKETFQNSSSSSSSSSSSEVSSERFPPGTKIETSFPDATLYNKIPKFGSWPTKTTIPAGAEGRLISYSGDYAKVELDDYNGGFIKAHYLVESIDKVIAPTSNISDTSTPLPLPNQLEQPAPDLPDPESLESDVKVKQKSLSTPAIDNTTGENENLYELSDEEIMQRIRERKEALLKQREAVTETVAPAVTAPAEVTPPVIETIKEEIKVPALDAPAQLDIPQLD